MSTHSTPTETYQCSRDACDRRFSRHAGVDGSFCSTQCRDAHHHRKAARDILNQLERDHRFCFSCFARHKEVDKPPAGHTVNIGPVDHPGRTTLLSKNCLIGFQYTTRWADEGQRTRSVDEYGRERLTGHGPTCECGNTHHRQHEPAIRDRFAYEIAHTTLVEAVAELRAEGKTDAHIDEDALDAALLDQGALAPTDIDWEAALAAALTS